jgi:hypothetical protein
MGPCRMGSRSDRQPGRAVGTVRVRFTSPRLLVTYHPFSHHVIEPQLLLGARVPTNDLSGIELSLSFLAYDFRYTRHVNDTSMFNNQVRTQYAISINTKEIPVIEGMQSTVCAGQPNAILHSLTHFSGRMCLPSLSELPALISALKPGFGYTRPEKA